MRISLILFIAGVLQSNAFAASSITDNELKEIAILTSHTTGKGNLLNPPRGSVAVEVQTAQKYVQDLIEELAGSALKAKGVHYVVNIYGDDSMNAWVQQKNPDVRSSQEARWKIKNPGEIWPVRKAWGFPDDGKPIYEIGITTALLRNLSTKDQLAFILGHELTHLLEGHTDQAKNSSEIFKTWWSSQSNEVVADHMAIDLVLGKYELDAALTVMELLHPKSDQAVSLVDSLSAATETHHAEGPRISALQFYIEYLRRYNVKAQVRMPIELPSAIHLTKMGRNFPAEGDPAVMEQFVEWIDKNLAGNGGYEGLRNESPRDKKIFESFDKLVGDPINKSASQLLRMSLERIEASDATKVQKTRTFLKGMLLLGSQIQKKKGSGIDFYLNWISDWSDDERIKLTRFLVENSSGTEGWSLNHYSQLLADFPFEYRKFIEGPFIQSIRGQQVIKTASQVSAGWNQTLMYWSSIDSFFYKKVFQAQYFTDFLDHLSIGSSPAARKIPDGDIKIIYEQNLLDSFKRYPDSDKLFQNLDDGGIPEFWHILKLTGRESDQNLIGKGAIVEALKPHLSSFKVVFLRQFALLLKTENRTARQNDTLRRSFELVRKLDLSSADMADLTEAYDKNIELSAKPQVIRDYWKGNSIENGEIEIVAKLIEMNSGNREKALYYLKYLLHSMDEKSAIPWQELPSASKETITAMLKSLTIVEIFHLTTFKTSDELQAKARLDQFVKNFGIIDYETARQIFERFSPDSRIVGARIRELGILGHYLKQNYKVQKNFLNLAVNAGDPENSLLKNLQIDHLKKLLTNLETEKIQVKFDMMAKYEIDIPQDAAKALLFLFLQNRTQISSFEEFVHFYERILSLAGPTFSPSYDQEKLIREFVIAKLNVMSASKKFQWLRRLSLQKVVGSEYLGTQVALYVQQTAGSDKVRLAVEAERAQSIIPLKDKYPDAYNVFRNQLAENTNVQPHEVNSVFPQDSRSTTEKIDISRTLIRGLSSFTTFTRGLTIIEQIEMTEFIMGRQEDVPKSVIKANKEIKGNKLLRGSADLQETLSRMREELKDRTVLERSMVVNSIFAGPGSMLNKDGGLKAIHDHLLKAVSPANQEIARILLEGLSEAEGRNKSLILSYALSQKSEGKNEGLSEALVLRSLLDSYGAPGVKLAQYLAFTSAFKSFQSVLEVYQDAAMPISYYDALLLLQKRLGDKWDPALYRVVKIIGSGSVNIAIEYENLKNKNREVVSISRDEIEVKTKEDFRRFRLLMKALTKTDSLKKKFDFVVGLMDLIEKSVTLEFDKQHAFEMQKSVQDLYRRNVDGWKIQTVDAFSVQGMSVLMEKAPGVGARKVLKSDPAAYESAMRAFMQVEYGVLRGVDQTQNWNPVPLHANPDIHDGQIMIDLSTKTITVLDFGQALKISNLEREFGLDILRIISKVESTNSSYELIQKYSLAFHNKRIILDKGQLEEALKKGERMDVFVHLLSLLSRSGFETPLSTVHWVLAANRVVKLGEKVRLSPESSIKWMLGMRKAGLPLAAYNASKSASDKVKSLIAGSSEQKSGGPVKCSQIFSGGH